MNTEEKTKRIKKEVDRLTKNYAAIDSKKRALIRGLIQRAAFMRVSLDELEADINTSGFTELFSQGDQAPYERRRPTADLYNTMNANYQKIIKQMTDLLPKDEPKKPADDPFGDFVNGREDG